MSENRRRYTCTKCGCWFITQKDYEDHLTIHKVKSKKDKNTYVNPDPVLFPYSPENQVLKHCKNSGSGNIWCYPASREKYGELCEGCYMNPDKDTDVKPKTGLDIYD